MFDDILFFYIFFPDQGFQPLINIAKFFPVGSFYIFPDDFQRITVLHRFVVIVCMQIFAEHFPGSPLFFQQGRTCQRYFYGMFIRIQKICQKTAFRPVAAMGFVDDENTLQVCGIGGHFHLLPLFLKPLYIDHRNFPVSRIAFPGLPHWNPGYLQPAPVLQIPAPPVPSNPADPQ